MAERTSKPVESDWEDVSDEWETVNLSLQADPATGMPRQQSSTDQLLNVLKSTAQAIPEAGGAVIGGILGGAAGAPAGPPGMFAGGVTGAGIGAGAGKALEVGALRKMFPNIFKGDGQDPTAEIANAANWGMASEAGGRGLEIALPAMFQRVLSPQVQKELATLTQNKVPYTAGDVRPGGAAQIIENLNRGTLLGGRVMQAHDVEQAKRLMVFKQRMLDKIGPLIGETELGNALTGAVETRASQLFDRGGLFDRAYQKVSQLYPFFVDTTKIRSEIIPLRDEVSKLVSEGRLPSASSPEAPSRFLKLLDDMSNYGTRPAQNTQGIVMGGNPVTRVDLPITYADVWKDKQTIDSIIRLMGDDALRTRAKSVVNRIHNVLDDAMESAAQQVDPKAARTIRAINESYGQAKRLFETESLVASLRNGKYNPDQVATRFFDGPSVVPEQDLLRAIPSNEKARLMPAIKRRTVQNMMDRATTPMKGETDGIQVTSGQRLEGLFSDRDTQTKLKQIFSPQELEGIQNFIDASKRAQMSGAMTNPASGRQIFAAGQVFQWTGAGLAMFTGQDAGGKFLLAGTTLITPYVLSQMLVNPKMANLLAKGFRISPTVAKATGYTARLTNLIRIYEDAEKKQEGQ